MGSQPPDKAATGKKKEPDAADGSAPPPLTTGGTAIPTGLIPMGDEMASRLQKIAEAAYRRAQQRNFAPGHDLEDWLEAEREVDGKSPP